MPPIPGGPPAPRRGGGGGRRRYLALVLAAVVGIAAVLGGVGWWAGWFDTANPPTMLTVQDMGPDPFGDNFGRVTVESAEHMAQLRRTGGVTASDGAVSGAARGLYGGSLDVLTCDGGGIADYLKADAGKRRAFASVVGVDESKVEEYILGLTSVVLLHDTWVTNHGYEDGKATAFPAVLQAGTAVLVDASGVPRVRCACGNPLSEPDRAAADPADAVSPWSEYSAGDVVRVDAGESRSNFEVVDVKKSAIIEIPRGVFKLDLKGTWTAYASWNSTPDVSLVIDSAVRLDGTITYGKPGESGNCVERFTELRRERNVVYTRAESLTPRKNCDGYDATMTIVDRTMTMKVTAGGADPLTFTKASG